MGYAIPLLFIYIATLIIFIVLLIGASIQLKLTSVPSKIKYFSPFIIVIVLFIILQVSAIYLFPLSHHRITNVSECSLYANPAFANNCRASLICGSYPGKANEENWLKCEGDYILGIKK